MDRKLFTKRLEDVLKAPAGSIVETTRLKDLENWDSIGLLSVIAIVDENYRVTLDAGALFRCETVSDLVKLVEKGS